MVYKFKQASESLVVHVRDTGHQAPPPEHLTHDSESLESAVLTGDVDPGLLEHLNPIVLWGRLRISSSNW